MDSNLQQFLDPNIADTDKYFCFLIIRQQFEAIIGVIFILACLTILIRSIFQYRKILKMPTVTLLIKFIYYTIFAWAALFLAQMIMSLIVYWGFSKQESEHMYLVYEKASRVLFILYISDIFLLQTVIILICYNWTDNMIKLLTMLDQSIQYPTSSLMTKSTSTHQAEQSSASQLLKYEKITHYVIRAYLSIRLLFPFVFIPFMIFADDDQVAGRIDKSMLLLFLIEAFFSTIVMLSSILLIRNNKKIREFINSQEIQRILKKYGILLGSCLIRLALDIVFIIYNFQQITNGGDTCITDNFQHTSRVQHAINFVISITLTHFLPIVVALRIYDIKNLDQQLHNSLLPTERSQRENLEQQNIIIS